MNEKFDLNNFREFSPEREKNYIISCREAREIMDKLDKDPESVAPSKSAEAMTHFANCNEMECVSRSFSA